MEINRELREYIVKNIFPLYKRNDSAHNIEHINYVIERSLNIANKLKDINLDIVYTVASFHDLGHYLDKDNHEKISAQMFWEDEKLKDYFSENARILIKEAIEDHRASLSYEPRSIYGQIISTADRNVDLNSTFKRIHAYTLKHYPHLTLEETIERAYKHTQDKFGSKGYAKVYFEDLEFNKFKEEVNKLLNNKYLFAKKYMEVNQIEDIKELAKYFAIFAHKGQVRKSEPEKPMIIHPLSVGGILADYTNDANVLAAGFLHDVVEDTKYSLKDIEEEFGLDIANLVESASESDKSLSWEERKQETISRTKTLSLRNKLVICADKINNLEDLYLTFAKSGERDFTHFKRGEEKQKWYYTNIYESLILGEDKDLPIFKRLKEAIDKVFYNKEDLFLKEIFVDNLDYFNNLKKIHAEKLELERLKSLLSNSKPFVIEFLGTPRTGKTTIINNLYDFFKKGGFNISLIEEFTTSKYYKEELKEKARKLSYYDKCMLIIDTIYQKLSEEVEKGKDIILLDRSLNDRQIWNYIGYKKGDIKESDYLKAKEKYLKLSQELIDYLVITYASPLTSLKRDYLNSLALETRSFLNIPNIKEYNDSLKELRPLLELSTGDYSFIDTEDTKLSNTSLIVTENILPLIRKRYITNLNKKYQ